MKASFPALNAMGIAGVATIVAPVFHILLCDGFMQESF